MIEKGRKTSNPAEARCSLGLTAAVLLMGAGTLAHADPIKLGIGQQEKYSDNIRLSHTNQQSDLESRTYVTIDQQSKQGTCQSKVNGELGFREYMNQTYSNQVDANAGLSGVCQNASGLGWKASDHISEVPQNSSLPSTPNNTIKRNIFSTGPQWLWQMNPQDSLSLSSSYEQTNYWGQNQALASRVNRSDRNNHRVLGSASFLHQLDQTFSLGLGGNVSKAYFNDGETITQNAENLLFNKQFAETALNGSVGYSRLEDRYHGTPNVSSGPVWQLSLDRTINEHSKWFFSYGRSYTDTSSTYALQIAGFNFNYQQTTAVRVTTYRAGYNNQLTDGSQFSASVGRDESRFLLLGEQDVTDSLDLNYQRPLAQLWTGTVGLGYQHEHFGVRSLTNDTYNAYVGTRYQPSRTLSFDARIGHNLRHSSESALAYAEDFVMLGVRYQFR